MRRQALPTPGARQIAVRLCGGALPEGRQKADGTARLAAVTTQGVMAMALALALALALAMRMMA